MAEDLGTLIAKLGADTAELKRGLGEGRQLMVGFGKTAENIASKVKQALSFVGLGVGLYAFVNTAKRGLAEVLRTVDDFEVSIIGMAATLTDLARKDAGLDYSGIFNRNVVAAKGMYEAIERQAAQHFASAQDMAKAYNQFLQMGYATRLDEVAALGKVVDVIKLKTAGQNQEVQINQEIRALLQGQATAHSAIARELEARLGPGWKALVEEHRRAGDLVQWLASLYPGIDAATEKITETLSSQRATLQSHLALLGREGLGGLYTDVVSLVRQINDFLKEHGKMLAWELKAGWQDVRQIIGGVRQDVEAIARLIRDLHTWKITIELGLSRAGAAVLERLESLWPAISALRRLQFDWKKAVPGLGAFMGALEGRRWLKGQEEPINLYRNELYRQMLEEGQAFDEFAGTLETEIEQRREESHQKGKAAAKGRAEDLLKILDEYLRAKSSLEIRGAEESLKTLQSEHDLKRAELAQALEAGSLAAAAYYHQVQELDAELTRQTLALLDLKIQKEKEAYQWALKELQARQARGEISGEAGQLMTKKLALEHETRVLALNAEQTRARLDDEKRLVEMLREQIRAREQISDLILDEEGQAAFTELEKREQAILRLLAEQKKARQELLELLGQAGATPAETAAALGRFEDAAARQMQIAKFGEEARTWAGTVAYGIRGFLDALMEGGRSIRQSLNRFFKDLFHDSLLPGFKALTAWLEKAFLDLFGSLGKSLAAGIMGVIGLVGMLLTSGGGKGSYSPGGVTTGVMSHEAVRGIVAGPTSIPIGQIGASLADALTPTNSILRSIDSGVWSIAKGAGGVTLNIGLTKQAITEVIDEYFADHLMMQT
jgi:hypothetical protein